MSNKSKYSDSKRFFNGVYIYGDYTKIPGYSKEALNKTFFFATVEDFFEDGYDGYYRSDEKAAKLSRNLKRDCDRREYAYNKYIRNNAVLMDHPVLCRSTGDMTYIEYEDKTSISPDEYAEQQWIITMSYKLVKKNGNELDKRILDSIDLGYETATEISRFLGVPRQTIEYRIKKLKKILEVIKEK